MIVTCAKMKLTINDKMMDIDGRVVKIIETIKAHNYDVMIVGGFVRDSLLNRRSHDYDIATNAPLPEIAALFHIENETYVTVGDHKVHTVSKISYEGISVEVTRFRRETYDENYNLKSIEFVDRFKDDVERRDFTMNAIAYDGASIIDLHNGKEDIEARVIKTINDPNIRFQEDPTRMLRALRFAATHDFSIEQETQNAINKHKSLILKSNNNNDDLKRLLSAPHFDKIYEQYADVFSCLSNGKFKNVKLKNRNILNDDRILFAYLVFSLQLNYDNTIYKHLNFSMKDKKFVLNSKALIRELKLPLQQTDIVLLYIAYGQNMMLHVYDMVKELNIINELNLLNIKKVFVEGYLKIDQLNVTVSDLNDSYTIKQKYRILKDIQKLIIRNELTNNREELLQFIQNYY